jgi:hypothetical protein
MAQFESIGKDARLRQLQRGIDRRANVAEADDERGGTSPANRTDSTAGERSPTAGW